MEIKDKIINVTIDLIKKSNGEIEKITIREIAKKANIGIGLINYHFESKKNLVDICVQQIISDVIGQTKINIESLTPMEKLKYSVKIPIDFIMDNPAIAKISILSDLMNGKPNDNTFKTLLKYYFYASNLEQNEDTFFKVTLLIHGLQGIFLRCKLYKDKFDFTNKQQRNRLIDSLVEKIFGVENE